MRERLLGRQLERGKLGRGGARGEGTAPAGLACRDGGVAERQQAHSSRPRGQRHACVRGWVGSGVWEEGREASVAWPGGGAVIARRQALR